MQYSEKALSYFKKEPFKLSCCQAVIAGCTSLDNPLIKECAKYGGGNAPEGLCGAAYAIKLLKPDIEDSLTDKFRKEAGACQCKEIRANGQTSCSNCVKIACDILQNE
ncbi:Conserved_hypothetical protein [Hexamita inflata]|uniref:Redox-active protein (C_GCAxxG_C_C) n=1 Tax=Hexamita inflata TaxID=28002 RepID=A0ABP1GL21_9EUKA